MAQGIMGLAPHRMAEGGETKRPQTLQEKARVRKLLQDIAMDGGAPDKGPDGQPDVRLVNGKWAVMVNGKPVQGMATGGVFKGRQQKPTGQAAQDALRGRFVVPPPPGYIPGFNPEMMYFQDDPQNPEYPAYSAPWENNLYAGSPINRFNPSGAPYFQSVIPGAQQPMPKNRSQLGGPGGMPGGGAGITGLAPGGGNQPAGPSDPAGGGAPYTLTPDRSGRRGNEGAAGGVRDPMGRGPLGMGSAPGGRGFNDYLYDLIPGAQQGTQLSPWQEGMLDNAGRIGMGLGMLTGIPGLGMIGNQLRNNWYMNNSLQSPMSGQNLIGEEIVAPQTGNDLLNEAIDGQSSPAGRTGRGVLSGGNMPGPAWGGPSGGGGWYYDSSGQLKFARSGHVRRSGAASGGQITLDGPFGPIQMAGGGVADIGMAAAPQEPTPEDLQMVAAAITGQAGEQSDAIINMFVEKYGTEVFRAIRDMVLQSVMPGAQTEGMVQGEGGGMDDQVPGMIGDQQPVAVSPGEYIVPADVVSGLGDGSSDAGAKELDRMLANVRQARGGGQMQPPPVDPRRVMPA